MTWSRPCEWRRSAPHGTGRQRRSATASTSGPRTSTKRPARVRLRHTRAFAQLPTSSRPGDEQKQTHNSTERLRFGAPSGARVTSVKAKCCLRRPHNHRRERNQKVKSTERASALGDRGWRDLLTQHNALVRRELARFRGEERDTAGDGFFATFDGPARAIRAADAIVTGTQRLGLG